MVIVIIIKLILHMNTHYIKALKYIYLCYVMMQNTLVTFCLFATTVKHCHPVLRIFLQAATLSLVLNVLM